MAETAQMQRSQWRCSWSCTTHSRLLYVKLPMIQLPQQCTVLTTKEGCCVPEHGQRQGPEHQRSPQVQFGPLPHVVLPSEHQGGVQGTEEEWETPEEGMGKENKFEKWKQRVVGLSLPLVVRRQIWRITNTSKDVHFLAWGFQFRGNMCCRLKQNF